MIEEIKDRNKNNNQCLGLSEVGTESVDGCRVIDGVPAGGTIGLNLLGLTLAEENNESLSSDSSGKPSSSRSMVLRVRIYHDSCQMIIRIERRVTFLREAGVLTVLRP